MPSDSDAGDEPEQGDDAIGIPVDSVKITEETVVRTGGVQGHWMPRVQTVSGLQWLRLSKWDRGLCKIVLKKGLSLMKGKRSTINVQWFQHMMDRRNLSWPFPDQWFVFLWGVYIYI